MTLAAVTSLHGSPGTTTLAMALAARAAVGSPASRRTLLVEADPDGGVLSARLDLNLQPSLTDLAGAARTGIEREAVWAFARPLGPSLHVVVARPSAEQTAAALRVVAGHLVAAFTGADETVVVDAGRLRPGSPALPLLEAADHVVVVVRPVLAQVLTALHGTSWAAERMVLGLVLVGTAPYSPRQVADVTGLPVLGSVVDDAAAVIADPFASSTKRRDAWATGVARLADRLGLTGSSAGTPAAKERAAEGVVLPRTPPSPEPPETSPEPPTPEPPVADRPETPVTESRRSRVARRW